MPSSSSSAGLSCRGVISSRLNASSDNGDSFRTGAERRSITARRVAEPVSLSRSEERSNMAFELPPLPYDYGALEPHIDEQTMRLHHDKHHQAYVDNANKALEGT